MTPATIPGPGVFESPDTAADLTTAPASPQAIDMESLRAYLAKEAQKKDLKAKLAAVEADLDAIEGTITTMMLGAGVDRMAVDGRLIYLANEFFVSPAEGFEKGDVIAALKADEDASVFVAESYNSNSLRSWVREIADAEQEKCRAAGELFDEARLAAALPAGLSRVLAVKFGKAVRTRKA